MIQALSAFISSAVLDSLFLLVVGGIIGVKTESNSVSESFISVSDPLNLAVVYSNYFFIILIIFDLLNCCCSASILILN